MATGETEGGAQYDPLALDLIERRFWAEIWRSVPAAVAGEHGVELRQFGPVQATVVGDLREPGMLNLVLGATEPGAVAAGHLSAALDWVSARGVSPYVPVTPGLADTAAAEAQLAARDFAAGPRLDEIRPRSPPAALRRRRRTSRWSS